MNLQKVTGVLKSLASTSLAGSWDNVGLLLEPSPPHTVNNVLLTNDLTPAVMTEAVNKGADMIVSYHPPIFSPLKRVTQSSWKERIVATCLERRIALYSPHTSWDAAADGVNDWLIRAFDVDASTLRPLEQSQGKGDGGKKLVFTMSPDAASKVTELPELKQNTDIKVYTEQMSCGGGDVKARVHVHCPTSSLPTVLTAIDRLAVAIVNTEITDSAKLPVVGCGMGRVCQLRSAISVDQAVTAVKTHLNLPHVRLAQSAGVKEILSVAVCAGSGGSVLRGAKADLYLTGEMSHHEVLDAVCKGSNVILCDHSNTERGFLKVIQKRLSELMKGVKVMVSETDRDPLVIV